MLKVLFMYKEYHLLSVLLTIALWAGTGTAIVRYTKVGRTIADCVRKEPALAGEVILVWLLAWPLLWLLSLAILRFGVHPLLH